jgi:8-oxo-dGTP pyrophosphatase MutT (NUDIX family)
VSGLVLAPAWQARIATMADRPPGRPRVPLWSRGARIGSVEPDLFERAGLAAGRGWVRHQADGWHVQGEPSAALEAVAHALRDAGLAHRWRNELLAVRDESGGLLGAVERGVTRPLGIATHAVHLLGVAANGDHWVQQRAFDKATDPGLWDTLVGGMVPVSDSLQHALERETWEEAGLRPAKLLDLRHGGRVRTQRPSGEIAHGYVIEDVDWFTCSLAPGAVPENQDGEVEGFALLPPGELARQLEADAFTLDAALLFIQAFGGAPRS